MGNLSYENMDDFKYLDVNMNDVIVVTTNNMHREINERISNGIKSYYAINKLLKS